MRAAPCDQIDRTFSLQAFGDLPHEIHRHTEHARACGDIKPLPKHRSDSATNPCRRVANHIRSIGGSIHDGTHSHHQPEQLECDHRKHVRYHQPQRDTAGGDTPAELAFQLGHRRQTWRVGEHEQQERDRRGAPMSA